MTLRPRRDPRSRGRDRPWGLRVPQERRGHLLGPALRPLHRARRGGLQQAGCRRGTGRAAAAKDRASEAQAGQTAEAELLDTEIFNSSQRLSTLPVQRDAEIAALRERRFHGTDALDQDAWKADMTRQMEAVAAKYQSSIDAEQARIDTLRARRAALGAPR